MYDNEAIRLNDHDVCDIHGIEAFMMLISCPCRAAYLDSSLNQCLLLQAHISNLASGSATALIWSHRSDCHDGRFLEARKLSKGPHGGKTLDSPGKCGLASGFRR